MGLRVVDDVDNIVIVQSGCISITKEISARVTILVIDAPAQFIKQICFLGLFEPLSRFPKMIIRIMQFRHIPASI